MPLPHAVRALSHRNFRLFFVGQGLSMIGTWVQQIAQSWLMYRLTGSAFHLGLVTFCSQAPILLIAPFGGWLSDRFDRRRLLLCTQSLLCLQALALALLTLGDRVAPWHILALVLFYGLVLAVDTPVRQSMMLNLVRGKDDLPSAIALNSLLMNGSRLLGPSIAGLLLMWMSEGVCFLINALSYIPILYAATRFRLAPRPTTGSRGLSPLAGLRDALAYAWRTPYIRLSLPMVILLSLTASPYPSLMPIFAREVLGGGSSLVGYMLGCAGFGAILATAWLATRRGVEGLPRMIGRAAAVAGLCLILFSQSRWIPLSLLLMAGVGFGIIATAASVNTLLQTQVEETRRGRVMGLYVMSFLGMTSIGGLLFGSLASATGAPTTLAITGSLCLAGAAVYRRALVRQRRREAATSTS